MDDIVAESTARARFSTILVTTFAIAALTLALIGIYAMMSFSVEERTREFGIRLAVGATEETVRDLMLTTVPRLTMAGLAAEVAGALALSRYLTSLIYGVRSFDPAGLGAVTLCLPLTALLTAYLPARRAARIDPVVSLTSRR